MTVQPEFRTPLAKVRSLGAAREGVGHFIGLRLSALALIPLTIWFVFSLLRSAIDSNPLTLEEWLASGGNATALLLMLLLLFYHSKLGIEEILVDYVHKPFWKYLWLIANTFLMYGFAALSVMAVFKLHFYPQGS